ncbi:MAG TPA: tripartite tricarboxylate transporter TctB family protein [Xanthobacteraceae bacterium]|jgi:putative tricarboxylic transport membrane protein
MSEDVNPSPKPPSFGFAISNASNLRGGSLVALCGLALLVATFYVSSPIVPRVVSIALILIGLGVVAGMVPIRAPRDFYGGLVLVMLATLALVSSAELPGQRGFAFGPGTAPRLFAGILIALGAAVSIVGLSIEGPQIEKYKIRGPVLVLAAIFGFAAMIRHLGLVPATFLAFMISILGSTEMRWIESVVAAAAMTLFCVVLFVYLLNLPFQLWPRFY